MCENVWKSAKTCEKVLRTILPLGVVALQFFSERIAQPFSPFSSKPSVLSRTKNQPKEEVFGTDIPRTSRGHSRGYPGPKLRSGRSRSWKNKHLGADIHDPKARTSTTPSGFHKLRSEKLRAELSFSIIGTVVLFFVCLHPCFGRPLKTTFDMTTLIFSSGGFPLWGLRTQAVFSGAFATPVLHLQNAIKSRK